MPEQVPEQVTISIEEYHRLLQAEAQLSFLENRGVDNWHGYGTIPSINEFDSLEEWQECIASLDNEGW